MNIFSLQKSRFSLLAILLILICISATDPLAVPTTKVTLLKAEETNTSKSKVTDIIGHDETGSYILRENEGGKLFIEHVNNKMVIDISQKISREHKKTGAYFSYAKLFSGNLYFFYTSSQSAPKGSKSFLRFEKVDKKTLLQGERLITVDSIYCPMFMNPLQAVEYTSTPLFKYSASSKDSYVAFFCIEPFGKENGEFPDAYGFKIRVIDSKMAKVWEKHVRIPYSGGIFSVTDVVVDDLGNVYMVSKEWQPRKEAKALRTEGKPDFRYHLYKYSANGEDEFEMPVEFGDKFISAIDLKTNQNGDMIASGFYSNSAISKSEETFGIKGAFYICIHGKTNEIKTQTFTAFEKDFITEGLGARQKQKAEKVEDGPELDDYYMDELLFNPDGSATLIAEQYTDFTNIGYYSNGYGGTYASGHTYYHFKNILVITFNPDGSIKWKRKIQKDQTSADDGGRYSSYVFATIGDKLYFIYNDNPDNLNLMPREAIHKHVVTKKAAVILAEIDNNGEVSKELLMNAERFELMVCPKLSEQSGEKEVLLLSENPRSHAFIKATFR
ncbi:hypothetical protein BH11BAC7_BH11BAC7_34280 [soil metagenome]